MVRLEPRGGLVATAPFPARIGRPGITLGASIALAAVMLAGAAGSSAAAARSHIPKAQTDGAVIASNPARS